MEEGEEAKEGGQDLKKAESKTERENRTQASRM